MQNSKQLKTIVLGGTNAHIPLIYKLKKRGYTTILVDYFENPPAKRVADVHIQASTLDPVEVKRIAKREHVDLIISTCVDQAYVTACLVSEELNLPAPLSYKEILAVTDKEKMKNKMLELGIPTAKYISVNTIEDFYAQDMAFPLVVKPADSNGSAGVRQIQDHLELKKFLPKALSLSRSGKAIVEEYKTGIEVGVDCYLDEQSASILLIRKKYTMQRREGDVLQSLGSISPVQVSDKARARLTEIANTIARGFKLKNTPLLMQAFIEDDNVNIIEIAPRVGGGLNYRTVKLLTGFDLLEAAINAYFSLGLPVVQTQAKRLLTVINVYASPGVFSHITGVKKLIENKTIKEFYMYRTLGSEIANDMSTRSRIGAFILCGKNTEELHDKLQIAVSELEVFTDKGQAVMRKDIYRDLKTQMAINIQ